MKRWLSVTNRNGGETQLIDLEKYSRRERKQILRECADIKSGKLNYTLNIEFHRNKPKRKFDYE